MQELLREIILQPNYTVIMEMRGSCLETQTQNYDENMMCVCACVCVCICVVVSVSVCACVAAGNADGVR